MLPAVTMEVHCDIAQGFTGLRDIITNKPLGFGTLYQDNFEHNRYAEELSIMLE